MRPEPKDCDFVEALAVSGSIELDLLTRRVNQVDPKRMEEPAASSAALTR